MSIMRKRGRLSSDTDDGLGMALSATGAPALKPCSHAGRTGACTLLRDAACG